MRRSDGVRMTSMKLWRPRFTVRTLAIFVTLVCSYLGTWDVTKEYGVSTAVSHVYRNQVTLLNHHRVNSIPSSPDELLCPTTPLPLVVQVDEFALDPQRLLVVGRLRLIGILAYTFPRDLGPIT